MYSNLELFKEYIEVENDEKDELLNMYLKTANGIINAYCGVDTFEKQTYEINVDEKGIYSNDLFVYFFLRNKPVISIDSINGENYDGIKGKDYLVINDRKVCFRKLPYNDWGYLPITYTAGYEVIPDDLKVLEIMLASGMYYKGKQKGISSYKLGDEQIVFGDTKAFGSADDTYFTFKNMIDKYKSFNLAGY